LEPLVDEHPRGGVDRLAEAILGDAANHAAIITDPVSQSPGEPDEQSFHATATPITVGD
jgi:hypothetical protein